MAKITYPLILVNFKTYIQGTGKKALELAKICDNVYKETGVCVAIAVQAADIRMIAKNVEIPIFAQHIDPIQPGKNTGKTYIGAIKEAGAIGALVNHSEIRMKLAKIEETIDLVKENGIYTCACANTARIAGAITALDPDCCAIEPPELIGTGISVSTTKPEVITDTIEVMNKINDKVVPLCGAGIANSHDVKVALELGTKGILISSRIVTSDDPGKLLLDMAKVAKGTFNE